MWSKTEGFFDSVRTVYDSDSLDGFQHSTHEQRRMSQILRWDRKHRIYTKMSLPI